MPSDYKMFYYSKFVLKYPSLEITMKLPFLWPTVVPDFVRFLRNIKADVDDHDVDDHDADDN